MLVASDEATADKGGGYCEGGYGCVSGGVDVWMVAD